MATAFSADKLAVAASEGADFGIDYRREIFKERVLEITAGEGAEVILDTVGGDVFEQSMRCIAWGGRLLVVGFAGEQIPQVKMNQPMLKRLSIVACGRWNTSGAGRMRGRPTGHGCWTGRPTASCARGRARLYAGAVPRDAVAARDRIIH